MLIYHGNDDTLFQLPLKAREFNFALLETYYYIDKKEEKKSYI